MKNKVMFTKDELILKAKEIKQKEKEYNQIVNQKPNVKTDSLEDVVDWFKELLTVLKK